MNIAIASGKGGTGKTTLSTNLAHYLAGTGRQVVLTDLDVEEPNSKLFLTGEVVETRREVRMVPTWNKEACQLCGACQTTCNFHAIVKIGTEIMIFPEMCHGCYACSELCRAHALPMEAVEIGTMTVMKTENFDFIESRLDIGQEQAVPLISKSIALVDSRYDTEVIRLFDSPPGTACPVIEVSKQMDFIILVTEPTPFGLHDLKLAVETMRHVGTPFAVVINRDGIGNADVEDYCREEHIDILARIPNDRKIAEVYSSGGLAYIGHERMTQALELVSEHIRGLEVRA